MVRLVRKTVSGKATWAEDAPTVCPAGHEGAIVPAWSSCPEATCDRMGRQWVCRAVEDGEQCGAVMLDPEHVHRTRYAG